MTIAYITETNLDRTEGRGTSYPIAIHSYLGNALEHGRKAGVMGTPGGVSVYLLDSEEPVSERAAKHGTLSDHREVIGSYRDGIGAHRWGVIPERVEKLTDDEKTRLEALRKLLGEQAPQADDPETGAETGSIGVIWAGFPGSIAGRHTAPIPRVLALVKVVAAKRGGETVIFDEARIEKVIADARQINPELGRVHVSHVTLGCEFTLDRVKPEWSEPEGFEALPEPDQSALVSEYEALAKKAGLL